MVAHFHFAPNQGVVVVRCEVHQHYTLVWRKSNVNNEPAERICWTCSESLKQQDITSCGMCELSFDFNSFEVHHACMVHSKQCLGMSQDPG